MMVVDYTQYTSFQDCPWKWVEKYVRGLVPGGSGEQRRDAAALGSLVHGGLEVLYKWGHVQIPNETMDEIGPTQELAQEALDLLNGYARTFYGDTWKCQELEKTLVWQIRPGNITDDGTLVYGEEEILGAAKLDRCMKLERDTPLATGLGDTEVMQAGWWGQEYKTKAPMKQHQRAAYIRSWAVNMQAAFQLRALREYVKGLGEDPESVRGVLVTVVERAGEYVPKRKCKNKECGLVLEMGAYIPVSYDEKLYTCPVCGWGQELSPVKENVKPRMAVYYRVVVTRTERQLRGAVADIRLVAKDMVRVKEHLATFSHPGTALYSIGAVAPRRAACVDAWWGRTCEYFEAHAAYADVAEMPGFEKRDTTRYMGLGEVAKEAEGDV